VGGLHTDSQDFAESLGRRVGALAFLKPPERIFYISIPPLSFHSVTCILLRLELCVSLSSTNCFTPLS